LTRRKRSPCSRHSKLVFLETPKQSNPSAQKREEAVKQLETYLEKFGSVHHSRHRSHKSGSAHAPRKNSSLKNPSSFKSASAKRQDGRLSAAVALAKSWPRKTASNSKKGAAEDLAESVSADLQRLKTEMRNSPRTQAKENSSAAATSLHSSSPKKQQPSWELRRHARHAPIQTRARISRSHSPRR